MKPKKLIWQIYPAMLIAVLAAIVAVTWYGSLIFKEFHLQQVEKDLEARASLIQSRVYDYLLSANFLDLRDFCREAGRQSGTRITIIDRQGLVLADSHENPAVMDNHRGRPEIAAAYGGLRGRSLRYSNTLGENLLYIAVPLDSSLGSQEAAIEASQLQGTVIRVSVPVTSLDRTIRSLQLRVLMGCLFVIIAAALLTLFISRNISRPLEEMTRVAKEFSRRNFSQRLIPMLRKTSSQEVTALATSMDSMAEILSDTIEAIEAHRNQLETVFASMVEAVIAVDHEERVLSLNTAAAKLFGVDRDSARGKVIQEIIRHSQLQEEILQVLDTGRAVNDEIIIRDEEGERSLQTNMVNLDDGRGASIGALIVMNDVTRVRQLEHIRQDFVANVSHELRTPITSIRGYTETLLDGAIDNREDSVRFLGVILRQSERLNAIVEDLLSLSRIEQDADHNKIELVLGELYPVLEAAMQTCKVTADRQGVELKLSCAADSRAMINHPLLEQAVVNLLMNAIQYSEKDSVVLLRAEVDKENPQQVLISVKDHGCGIAAGHLARLFERFYRSDKARSRQVGGTGLGLAIVKHIVQAHEGEVTVESEVGKGTIFTIYLRTNAA